MTSRCVLGCAVIALTLAVLALPVAAQPAPPNWWHPYRGGTNCVQVADKDGNFSCAAGTKVDPATGNLTIGGTLSFQSVSGTANQFPGAVIIDTPVSGQSIPWVLGNDLDLGKNALTAVAAAGPGPNQGGGVILRVRPSPTTPGACRVVAIAGNAFGDPMEFPLAFLPPSMPFFQKAGTQRLVGGPVYDGYVVELPGGPGGC